MAELKLLKLVEGGGPEPGVHGCCPVLEVIRGDAEPAAGPRVGGNDSRHHAGEPVLLVGETTAVEVERRGAPDVAPPGREDLGAGAVLGAEEGDDLTEDGVGEVADAVDASIIFISCGRRLCRVQTGGFSCRRRRRRRRLCLLAAVDGR